MSAEFEKVRHLLASDSLKRVETQISEKIGCSIYKDNLPILVQLIEKEIDCSLISIDVISNFIDNNEKVIVDFGLLLLEKESIQMLSLGFSITYAIYLILLQRKDDVSLEDYLVRRRIPDSIKFLKQLNAIKHKMNF